MADIQLTKKQTIAWGYLMDNTTKEVLFGSGAGSGKSFLGCLWVVSMCLKYPGVRYLIGRAVLSQLRLTTLRTLLETLKVMGLNSEKHFNYNQQTNVVSFYNGSEIILKDMASTPSDPQFDSLGSLEISGCFLDEMTQISLMAFHIIKSRIRYKLNEYNILGKLFMSCNPHQGYLKSEFYIPFIEDRLDESKKFVMATALDNPNLPEQYIETLNNLPAQQRERLLMGNWDYSDDISALFQFDDIVACSFRSAPNPSEKKYISLDVARFGGDSTVATIWVGLTIVEIVRYNKLDGDSLYRNITELITKHGIHPSQVIADSDGVGGFLVDRLRCTSFVNNSRALHEQNFTNLKSQCYVKLADLIKQGKISINVLDPTAVDELTQQLLAVKLKDVEKDGKVGVIGKDAMKRLLGDKSPDLADSIMLRMYYEIKNLKSTGKYAIAFAR